VNGVSAARRVIVLVAALVALAVGAPPGYWKQMGTIMTPKEDYNYTDVDGRKAVMARGIGYMKAYPVFGVGIDNFPKAECTISPKLASRRINGPLRCTAPHNSYLEAGSELGVPGFLMWISLVIGGIIGPLRLRNRLPKSWRRGTGSERFIYNSTSLFPVAMVGFAVTSFFVSFAWMDPVYLMAALLTGLYVSTRKQLLEESRAGIDDTFATAPQRPAAGWRVKRSAWRIEAFVQSQPKND
jgi:O-antigen ligase